MTQSRHLCAALVSALFLSPSFAVAQTKMVTLDECEAAIESGDRVTLKRVAKIIISEWAFVFSPSVGERAENCLLQATGNTWHYARNRLISPSEWAAIQEETLQNESARAMVARF